ncbi:(2Fe-2S)-binding protein [Paenibacillus sp. UNC451MF]|uniref:(2Fe-2S)-binding protein n=1 Tax=Paenibacillus sp. UNC451MF TaxID=1449063 RepID=UPI00048B5FD1|nr:(2Fe-2S)-binding protein [Paenibacillus sp. UNC451MF]
MRKDELMSWRCVLNGSEVVLQGVPFTRRLVEILRDDLLLTGTKVSCEMGRCGACMVLMNGRTVNSCLVMAYQCMDQNIMTVEGLEGPESDPVQRVFLEEGAFQCGYCTSGMIMSVKGLLNNNPCPTRQEVEEGLSGNLCRCTGYGSIIRAVEKLGQ